MKNIVIFIAVLSLIGCSIIKERKVYNLGTDINKLVDLVIEDMFSDFNDICLNRSSVAFSFRFPEELLESDIVLSFKEKLYIEKEFEVSSVDWKEELVNSYPTEGDNCLFLSKPILLRKNSIAFIYKSHMDSEFYDVYEKKDENWKFKESLMILF